MNRPLDFSGETSRSICSSDFWIDWVILSWFGSSMGLGSSSTTWAKELDVRTARANKDAMRWRARDIGNWLVRTGGLGGGLRWEFWGMGLGGWARSMRVVR